MPSPFPGMNPYLEQDDVWHDFHEAFLPKVRAQITAQLPGHYIVKIDEHVYIHEPSAAVDVEGVSFLEIRDRRDRRLVTVIELLSPANKYSSPDREQYLVKRSQLLASAVHLVEIDLLRGGPRMPFVSALPECDYYALVSRMEKRPEADFWAIHLRNPLPIIPIPVRPPDPEVRLDLQATLHSVYDEACYGNYIYAGTPQPALRGEDAAWSQAFVPHTS
jgi:hypothetical protein